MPQLCLLHASASLAVMGEDGNPCAAALFSAQVKSGFNTLSHPAIMTRRPQATTMRSGWVIRRSLINSGANSQFLFWMRFDLVMEDGKPILPK
jgi:hypothetical protein